MGRQEMRTKETRELLMRAARTIFIRDGYEGADLNDIAELAGRTKGAIYGHFKSKEEIFLALIADHRQEYRDRLRGEMTRDVKQNIAVMRQFVIDLAEEDDWALLQLEFKMFTLRHPETKERFKSLYEPWTTDREELFARLLGTRGQGEAVHQPNDGGAFHSPHAFGAAAGGGIPTWHYEQRRDQEIYCGDFR